MIGRFISADTFATTDATGFLNYNMFAYCKNDPVDSSDPSGHYGMIEGYRGAKPIGNADGRRTAMVIISVAEIVGGTVLIAAGGTSPVGAMLLAAGTSSLINGNINEQSGGSFFGGWAGGQVSGAIAGYGLSIAGSIYNAATCANATSTVLGYASSAFGFAGLSGFLGGSASSAISQFIDKGSVNSKRALKTGLFTSFTSMLATPFSAVPSAISNVAPALAGGVAVFAEWVFNSISSMLDRLFNH